jgi:hypothetical protein
MGGSETIPPSVLYVDGGGGLEPLELESELHPARSNADIDKVKQILNILNIITPFIFNY